MSKLPEGRKPLPDEWFIDRANNFFKDDTNCTQSSLNQTQHSSPPLMKEQSSKTSSEL